MTLHMPTTEPSIQPPRPLPLLAFIPVGRMDFSKPGFSNAEHCQIKDHPNERIFLVSRGRTLLLPRLPSNFVCRFGFFGYSAEHSTL